MTVELLKALGLNEEQIVDRAVEQIAKGVMTRKVYRAGEDGGEEDTIDSDFRAAIDAKMTALIQDGVNNVALRHVAPKVETFIENFKLQQTNTWGEKVGEAVTFTQYIIARAEAWINEPVDFQGKTKTESGYGSWTKSQARVSYMIDQHLQYHIKNAMTAALSDLNSKVATGIADTVKAQLSEALAKLRLDVKMR